MRINIGFLFVILFYFNITFKIKAQTQTNILWIVTEDISPTLSMYGDHTAKTPNLDQLAKVSTVYQNAFAVVAVCGPSRSSIITGMYPTSIGTMHMRTGKDITSWGQQKYALKTDIKDINGDTISEYSAVIPPDVKCFTEYLRAAGYYCTNNAKTDYQFAAPFTAWDENDDNAHWRNREKNQPFFSVFNFNDTHESMIWKNSNLALTVDPSKIIVPPYFPNDNTIRKDIARHYSNMEVMDTKVGQIIQQLKEDGLYENTIIFFYSDHGGPLPNQKRETNDRGLKIPLLIKGVKQKKSKRNNELVSLVDLAPTVLSLAGIKPSKTIQGDAFLGKFKAPKRDFIFASGDRFDEFTDKVRAIRDDRYLLVKNYFPKMSAYKDVAYRKAMPITNKILELKEQNKLNKIQAQWFAKKDSIELYDTAKDPFNIKNLAFDPAYLKVRENLQKKLMAFTQDNYDRSAEPEKQMIYTMWPKGIQPTTQKPAINPMANTIALNSTTSGASIGYYISDQKLAQPKWKIYHKPIEVEKGKMLFCKAIRIGYKESEVVAERF
jgi:N-sulfoglucosamine sulfohydrolase